ncbi:hypothetical protein [Pikeienuella piscinae]|uniref:hypothetical protein n=1 Tax=Pikeienuella piscinae TaxID=2748098 RepID=UPI0015D27113|nr:hypothetical protein [Pikeienuella piscinae]
MIVLGLNWIRAGLMWWAVRAGGWADWCSRQPETFTWRILRLPWIPRVSLIWTVTVIRGLWGALVIELLSLKTYRAEAARIRALDAPE